jgi:long-chain acyl-CoA synthetase
MGAPLPVATQKLWQMWGVDMINIYGSTESGFVCAQRPGFPKPGNIGKPTSINKVKLAEDGEVTVSGPGVFKGYWKNEEATLEVKKEGWLHTGDVGEWTGDGNLKLVDRKKDIMITAGGKNITPSLIETTLKGSPYISEAVLIADGRKFPSALIEIDFDTVSDWARRNKVLYTSFTSLAEHPDTIKMIAGEVEEANQSLARVEQVKKFRIIPKELDPEEGDTTATRKIKRKTMNQLFEDLIEEMYGSAEDKAFKL